MGSRGGSPLDYPRVDATPKLQTPANRETQTDESSKEGQLKSGRKRKRTGDLERKNRKRIRLVNKVKRIAPTVESASRNPCTGKLKIMSLNIPDKLCVASHHLVALFSLQNRDNP